MSDTFDPRPVLGRENARTVETTNDTQPKFMSMDEICAELAQKEPALTPVELAIKANSIFTAQTQVKETAPVTGGRKEVQCTDITEIDEPLPEVDMRAMVPPNLESEPVLQVKPTLPKQVETPVKEARGQMAMTITADETPYGKHIHQGSEAKTTTPMGTANTHMSGHAIEISGLTKMMESQTPASSDKQPDLQQEETAPAENGQKQDAPKQPAVPIQNVTTKLSETSTLPPDDMRNTLLTVNGLVGCTESVSTSSEVRDFMSSLNFDYSGNMLARSEAEERRYELTRAAMSLTPPVMSNNRQAFDMALSRPNVTWSQSVNVGGKDVFSVSSRASKDRGARGALRRNRGTGSPVTIWLPSTGIYVGFRAANEVDICDFDVRMTTETATIGMQTYGLLLSASSGVYMRHMIEHALNFATDTTYNCDGNDLKTVLLNVVDIDDYWLIILGPIIAQYPGGLPWNMVCPSDPCGHSYNQALNLARCIRMAEGLFTDRQRKLWMHQRGASPLLSHDQYEEYRKDLPKNMYEKFADEKTGATVTFKRCLIGEFLDGVDNWVEQINTAVNNALATNSTETERAKHIRLTTETHRLTRYAASVKSIAVTEERDGEMVTVVEEDPAEIVSILADLSSDRIYVRSFEDAIYKYNEYNRMAVFGYMGRECPMCGEKEGETEGTFRGLVGLSPDKLFFVLSRSVYEIQKLYRDRFASIG